MLTVAMLLGAQSTVARKDVEDIMKFEAKLASVCKELIYDYYVLCILIIDHFFFRYSRLEKIEKIFVEYTKE